MLADLQELFADPEPPGLRPPCQTVDKGHGRIERRVLRVSTALAGYTRFPGLAQVGEVQKQVIALRTGEVKESVQYFATSLQPTAATPAQLLTLFRGHWGVETRLHYVQDDSFREDRQVQHAHDRALVLAGLRGVALNLLRGKLFLWESREPMTARAAAVACQPLGVLLFTSGL